MHLLIKGVHCELVYVWRRFLFLLLSHVQGEQMKRICLLRSRKIISILEERLELGLKLLVPETLSLHLNLCFAVSYALRPCLSDLLFLTDINASELGSSRIVSNCRDASRLYCLGSARGFVEVVEWIFEPSAIAVVRVHIVAFIRVNRLWNCLLSEAHSAYGGFPSR